MRHLLAIAALGVCPLTAAAQSQDSQQQPGRMSLPTRSVFSGGFTSGPLFGGVFPHPIYPNGFPRMAIGAGPARPIHPQGPARPPSQGAGPIPGGTPPLAPARTLSGPDIKQVRAALPDMSAPKMQGNDSPAPFRDDGGKPAAVRPAAPVSDPVPVKEPSAESQRAGLLAKLPRPSRAAGAATGLDTTGCSGCCGVSPMEAKRRRDMSIQVRDTHLSMTEDRSTPVTHSEEAHQPAPLDPQDQQIAAAPGAAADSLRDHLGAQPDDFPAMRLYAVALLSSKHAQAAADAMAKAYQSDPLLAKEPIDLKAAGFEGARVAALVKSAEDAARQSKSASSWLLAAVLHQAKGSQAPALSALDNARRAGLNADVSDWLTAELKKPPPRIAQAAPK